MTTQEEPVYAVLREYERNYHDDSDFMAFVWDEKKQKVREVRIATTRHGGESKTRKATDEERALAIRWLESEARVVMQEAINDEIERPHRGVMKRGTLVRFISDYKPRKADVRHVAQGEVGSVIWVGDGWHRDSTRVGVRFDDESVAFVCISKLNLVSTSRDLDKIVSRIVDSEDYGVVFGRRIYW
jgi:hypothetical protein